MFTEDQIRHIMRVFREQETFCCPPLGNALDQRHEQGCIIGKFVAEFEKICMQSAALDFIATIPEGKKLVAQAISSLQIFRAAEGDLLNER